MPQPAQTSPAPRPRGPAPKVRRAPVDDLPARSRSPVSAEPGSGPAVGHSFDSGPTAPPPALQQAVDSAPEAQTQPATELEDGVHPELLRSWRAFQRLGFEDKLTAGSAGALALMSAMPWRSSLAEGDEIGILGWGIATLALAVAAGASIWARRAGKQRPLAGAQWALLAIASGGAAAVAGVVAILTSSERTLQFGAQVTTAWPSFGAYGAVLCSGGVVLGGLLTLVQARKG